MALSLAVSITTPTVAGRSASRHRHTRSYHGTATGGQHHGTNSGRTVSITAPSHAQLPWHCHWRSASRHQQKRNVTGRSALRHRHTHSYHGTATHGQHYSTNSSRTVSITAPSHTRSYHGTVTGGQHHGTNSDGTVSITTPSHTRSYHGTATGGQHHGTNSGRTVSITAPSHAQLQEHERQ